MNDFLRCFLNVPKNGIEDIFIFTKYNKNKNKKEIDSRFDELYAMLRLTYNIDVKSIVSSVINNYNSNPFQQSNATIINAIIKTIDNTLRKDYLETNPIYEVLNDEKYINHTNKKTNKARSKYANNNLDMYTTIEYIICNLFQIIKSKNFTKTFRFSELRERFPALISDKSDSSYVISHNTIKKSIREHYYNNFLYNLLLPDGYSHEKINDLLSNDKKVNDTILNSNYIYCEDFEEIMIASTLKGADNVYNSLFYNNEGKKSHMKKYENGFISPKLYQTFANDYTKLLNTLCKHTHNNLDIDERDSFTKENVFTKYYDFSVHSINYISDMIFAFGLSSELSRLYEENKDLIPSSKYFAITASILFTVPELTQREKYALLALTELHGDNYSDSDTESIRFKKVFESYMANIYKFDSNVYYPILVLTIIEYLRRLYNKSSQKYDFVIFCLDKLNEIYNELKKHDLLYKFNINQSSNKSFAELPFMYNYISELYICNRELFDKKITSYTIEINAFCNEYLSFYES